MATPRRDSARCALPGTGESYTRLKRTSASGWGGPQTRFRSPRKSEDGDDSAGATAAGQLGVGFWGHRWGLRNPQSQDSEVR